MFIAISKNNVPIRLTEERLNHIIRRHPEMLNQIDKILTTIENPDFIQKGDMDELLAVKFFDKTPLTKKYLVVVYRELSKEDGFVITAYFTSKPSKRREILWKA